MEAKILVSYPADQESSVEVARKILAESNDYYIDADVLVRGFDWKTNIITGKSDRGQSVINDQIDRLDGIIAIIGHRIGSPTGFFDSGVEEELDVFVRKFGLKNKRIHLLFNESSNNLSEIKSADLDIRNKFRDTAASEGYFFADFTDEEQLRKRVRQAVGRIVNEVKSEAPNVRASPRNRRERRAKEKDDSLFVQVEDAIAEIGEGFVDLEPIMNQKRVGRAQALADQEDRIVEIVEFLTESDAVMSRIATKLDRNLKKLYGAALKGLIKKTDSENYEDEWLKNFTILAVVQIGASGAPALAKHYRKRADEVEKIPAITSELAYSITRSAQSLRSIATTIEVAGERVQKILSDFGWSVVVPTSLDLPSNELESDDHSSDN